MKKLIFTLIILAMAATGFGATLDDGLAAYFKNDYATAKTIFEKLANNEETEAMYWLGIMYRFGEGVSKDYTNATEWLYKAAMINQRECDYNGSNYCCDRLDNIIKKHVEPMANHGNAEAQYALGQVYKDAIKTSKGVKQDYSKSVKWYKKAADQRHVKSQRMLGIMYANGIGVKQDYTKSAEWFLKAADQGDAESQYLLGSLYETGEGVKKDDLKAVEWYQRSASQGHIVTQSILGNRYKNGRGVNQDYIKAVEWFQKAADQGCVNSQEHLGDLYRDGKGVTQDHAKAAELYQEAMKQHQNKCDEGSVYSCKEVAAIQAKIKALPVSQPNQPSTPAPQTQQTLQAPQTPAPKGRVLD